MMDPTPAPHTGEHDHESCVTNAVAVATELCQRRGVRLTALRQRVLELVWHSHAPIGAYDILDRLRVEDGRLAAPPTVYRALEFLMEQKLIHRIESLNAFVGCIDPRRPHSAQYLICRDCGTVTELEDRAVAEAIAGQAARQGFSIDRQTVEVHGLCGHCARSAKAGQSKSASAPTA